MTKLHCTIKLKTIFNKLLLIQVITYKGIGIIFYLPFF